MRLTGRHLRVQHYSKRIAQLDKSPRGNWGCLNSVRVIDTRALHEASVKDK